MSDISKKSTLLLLTAGMVAGQLGPREKWLAYKDPRDDGFAISTSSTAPSLWWYGSSVQNQITGEVVILRGTKPTLWEVKGEPDYTESSS